MSVHPEKGGYRVKWRENGKQRSRMFDRKGDADHFDIAMRRALQLGPHLVRELERSALTLEAFVRTGFRTHAATLSADTRRHYRWALENHLTELLDEPLLTLDVPRLATHQQHLLDHGRTANTVRQAMTRLSGILQVAVEHGHIPANPARTLRKIPAEPRDEVNPLAPVELERLIAALDGRGRIIGLLGGHLGLRPLEIRQAPWDAFDGSTLTVGRARTKRSAARTRIIDVPEVTAHELKAWRLQSGGRGDEPIIGELGKDGLRLWAYKHLDPAARRATGRADVTLYTLRHSHASALHYCDDYTLPRILKRLGHSAPVHFQHYAHVIQASEGKPHHATLDALIGAARAKPVFRHGSAEPR